MADVLQKNPDNNKWGLFDGTNWYFGPITLKPSSNVGKIIATMDVEVPFPVGLVLNEV